MRCNDTQVFTLWYTIISHWVLRHTDNIAFQSNCDTSVVSPSGFPLLCYYLCSFCAVAAQVHFSWLKLRWWRMVIWQPWAIENRWEGSIWDFPQGWIIILIPNWYSIIICPYPRVFNSQTFITSMVTHGLWISVMDAPNPKWLQGRHRQRSRARNVNITNGQTQPSLPHLLISMCFEHHANDEL